MEGLTSKGVTSGLGAKMLSGNTALEQETAMVTGRLFFNIHSFTIANDSQKSGLIYQGQHRTLCVCEGWVRSKTTQVL